MNITPTNDMNFKAYLDISKVKTNKARWANVAKMLPDMTKKQPYSMIEIVEGKNDTKIRVFNNIKEAWDNSLEASSLNATLKKIFAQNDDKKVANALLKFLRLSIDGEKELAKVEKFANSMASMNDNANLRDYSDTFDYFYAKSYSIIKDSLRKKINKDPIMKQWEVSV